MSDSYQAVFDAVRSRIGGCDVGYAVESALRGCFEGADHQIRCAAQEFISAAQEQQRPSALLRPALKIDGNRWCALYGENLQDGVAGFGDSPADAMRDFDANWVAKLSKTAEAA